VPVAIAFESLTASADDNYSGKHWAVCQFSSELTISSDLSVSSSIPPRASIVGSWQLLKVSWCDCIRVDCYFCGSVTTLPIKALSGG